MNRSHYRAAYDRRVGEKRPPVGAVVRCPAMPGGPNKKLCVLGDENGKL